VTCNHRHFLTVYACCTRVAHSLMRLRTGPAYPVDEGERSVALHGASNSEESSVTRINRHPHHFIHAPRHFMVRATAKKQYTRINRIFTTLSMLAGIDFFVLPGPSHKP